MGNSRHYQNKELRSLSINLLDALKTSNKPSILNPFVTKKELTDLINQLEIFKESLENIKDQPKTVEVAQPVILPEIKPIYDLKSEKIKSLYVGKTITKLGLFSSTFPFAVEDFGEYLFFEYRLYSDQGDLFFGVLEIPDESKDISLEMLSFNIRANSMTVEVKDTRRDLVSWTLIIQLL